MAHGTDSLVLNYSNDTIESIELNIKAVLDRCVEKVSELVEQGFLEKLHGEEYILGKINTYLKNNGDELKEFLGEDGKSFIAMNSAEKFGDIMTHRLGIPDERVTKEKISTYAEDMQSNGGDIPEEVKQKIRDAMNLQKGDHVLLIEDMIDSGNTLVRLVKFFEDEGAIVKVVSLLDKNNPVSSLDHLDFLNDTDNPHGQSAKSFLGDKLSSVMSIKNEFVIGFGMDWVSRILADLPGLYKVVHKQEDNFMSSLQLELETIQELEDKRQELLGIVTHPIQKK